MNSTIKIHFWYVVGILVGLLVLVITDRWTDKANFTVFLSNAATLTSLVLGLVAIFYSVIANADLSKSLGNIGRVSEEVVATRVTMGDFIRESQELVETGRHNAEALKSASSTVAQDVSHLESILESLRAESQQLRDSVGPIPGRIDQLAARIAEAIPQNPAPATPREQSPSAPGVDKEAFLRRSSLIGLVSLYGIAEAHRNKTIFDCDAVATKIGAHSAYVHGFTVALHSTGLLTNKAVKDRPRSLEITAIAPYLAAITIEDARANIRSRDLKATETWVQHLDAVAELMSGKAA